MKTNLYVLLTGLLLLLWQLPQASAQTKIQVVTKTIERKLDYSKHTELRITGEKATIRIQGWDKNYIGLTLKLIAKHPDRAIAEKELEHLRYIIEKNDNVHDVGNYFNVAKNTNPIRANLKAEYELMVPENCPILLTAKYGEAFISRTTGRSEISLEYSKLTLQDVKGDMTLKSTLGDISGSNVFLTLDCKAQRADIDFSQASGSYQIENTYGHIRLKPTEQLKKLHVQGNRTDVALAVKNFDSYNYDITATNSDITLPSGKQQRVKSSSGGKSTFQETNEKGRPLIKITTSSSPVVISLGNL